MDLNFAHIREKLAEWEKSYELSIACRGDKIITDPDYYKTDEAETLRNSLEKEFNELFEALKENKSALKTEQDSYMRGGDFLFLSKETWEFERKRKNLEKDYFALLGEIISHRNAFDPKNEWFHMIKYMYLGRLEERLEKIKKTISDL